MKNTLLVAALALLCGCEGMSVADAYVEADRLTYEAIGTSYRRYVEADQELNEASKQSRYRLLDSWKMRIDANTKEKN